jgi:hypothetical protein
MHHVGFTILRNHILFKRSVAICCNFCYITILVRNRYSDLGPVETRDLPWLKSVPFTTMFSAVYYIWQKTTFLKLTAFVTKWKWLWRNSWWVLVVLVTWKHRQELTCYAFYPLLTDPDRTWGQLIFCTISTGILRVAEQANRGWGAFCADVENEQSYSSTSPPHLYKCYDAIFAFTSINTLNSLNDVNSV